MPSDPTARPARYSHSGICVSDLARSKAFYRNVFGFVDGSNLEVVNANHAMMRMDGDFTLQSHFLRLGGLVIELLYWPVPGHIGTSGDHRLNELGLTHLSFNVDDLAVTAAAVLANGGTVREDSRISFALPHMTGDLMFVADPDGTQIEVMAFPEDVVNA